MVKIGNTQIGLPNFNWSGILMTTFWIMLIVIVLCVFGYFMWLSYKKKRFYPTPVTLTYKSPNGRIQKTIYGIRGGKFLGRGGVWCFRCLIPKQFKDKEIGLMPDFDLADGDGTIHFVTIGDGTLWQQLDHSIKEFENKEIIENGEKVIKRMSLVAEPIDTDVKLATANQIRNFADMMNESKIKIISMALGVFIVLAIAFIIGLVLMYKVKCGV